jgi:hypothetical protein
LFLFFKKESAFFFEKKKQKTFVHACVIGDVPDCGARFVRVRVWVHPGGID